MMHFLRISGSRVRTLGAAGLLLGCLWLFTPVTAQSQSPLQFDVQTVPFVVVANTGLSEVLSEISLVAKPSCGTAEDFFCVSEAEKLEVRLSNVGMDNSSATGIRVCETISGAFSCNQEGLFLTGVVTTTSNVVSIHVKQGVNLAAFDRITIAGIRVRVAESFLVTPGLEANATLAAIPAGTATFPPDMLILAHSARPLALEVTSVPEIPCSAENVIPTILVKEAYAASFVDNADPLERSFPGPPVLARNPFGANHSTRISLKLSGLKPGVRVEWPMTVPAQNSGSKLDLLSQSPDGSTATYVYSTPSQLPNDTVSETFAVRLNPVNFRFSGSEPLEGVVSVQAQLLPAALPASSRPRFDHPLGPEPGIPFMLLKRCTVPSTATGSATLHVKVDGEDWAGNFNVRLEGPALFTATQAPQSFTGLPVGTYTAYYLSGGPAGAELDDILPLFAQALTSNATIDFEFVFAGPTIANLHYTTVPQVVCPSASTAVGSIRLTNATPDTQVLPAGTFLEFTFNRILTVPPQAPGLEGSQVTSTAMTITYRVPEPLVLPSGASITLSGAEVNLNGVANGQQVTVLVTSNPPAALQLNVSQLPVATAQSSACPPPPAFLAQGVTNGASFLPGLAVGSIATIFGSHLTSVTGIVGAATVPLPTALSGTSVTVNGVAAPLFAVADVGGQEQINFQVPWQVAGQTPVSIIVRNGNLVSEPQEVPLRTAFPGIFTTDGTRGAILHGANSALVTPASPAAPGEVVVIYATGLGPVSNPPASGAAALSDPLSPTLNVPVVTVGGIPATVEFSGLAPGFVGLYQINVRLPENVPSGTQQVIVQVAGQASKPATIAIQ